MLLQKSADMLKSSSDLIENVRKLRKAELGELKLEPVDLCGIIESVRRKYSTVPGRSVDINVISRHRQTRTVMANRLLEDVFANLVSNTIKHSLPDQHVSINIILSEVCEDGRECYRVAIEDNGPGITDELKGKLFTRLQRGKTKTAGRGLGLYLVKALVKDFGGKIWVEDRVPGHYQEGTRFVVLLPAAQPEAEAETGTCAG
jgi:signal transduction histidine kinase